MNRSRSIVSLYFCVVVVSNKNSYFKNGLSNKALEVNIPSLAFNEWGIKKRALILA